MTVQIPSSTSLLINPDGRTSRPWFTFFENINSTLNSITISGDVISVFGRGGIVTAQSGDYTASQITNVASGNITATNVQSAINQLDTNDGLIDITNISGDDNTYYPVFVSGSGSLLTSYINNSSFQIINGSSGPDLIVGNLELSSENGIRNDGLDLVLSANGGLAVKIDGSPFEITSGEQIRLYNNDNSNYVALQSQGSLGATYTLTFPSDAGSGGEVLSTDGSGNLSWAAALSSSLTSDNIFIGNSFNVATEVTISGDATLASSGVLTLADTGVVADTYGSSTEVAQLQIDSKGRIVSASNVTITGIDITAVTADNIYYPAFTLDSSTLDTNSNLIYTISGGVGTLTTNALKLSQNTGLQLADLSGSFLLTIKPNSSFTNYRTLSLTTGDSDRNLTFAGDATISGTNTGDITLSGQNYLSLSGQALTANQIDLTANVTGILPVVNGGTGAASLTQHGVLLGQGTGAVTSLTPGSTGQLLTANSSANPAWTNTTYPSTSNQGDIIYASALNNFTTLAKSSASTRYLSNQGTSNGPSWSQVNLGNGVTGSLSRASIAADSAHTFVFNDNSTGLLASYSISTIGNFLGYVDTNTVGQISLAGTSGQIDITSSLSIDVLTLTFAIDSGYVGQSSITTLGTISTGVWQGTKVAETYGGTNQTSYTLGDILYSSASNILSKLAGNTTTTKQYLSQTGTGTVSGAPAWATISGSDITGAALTRTNDTNVTLTLGGSPTTALLNAASLTLGWTGQLGLSRGGTNADLSATGGTSQVLKQASLGGAITVGQLAASDLSNGTTGSGSIVLATSPVLTTPNIGAATGTSLDSSSTSLAIGSSSATSINIGNTSSTIKLIGTTQLQGTSSSTSHITFSYAPTANRILQIPNADSVTVQPLGSPTSSNWVQYITSSGVQTLTQPAFSDISGTVSVAQGGTGQTSYTNGQLLIGNTTGNTLTKSTLTGTSNQITITNGTGSITLSTPQDIGTSSSVTFGGLTLNGNATITPTSTSGNQINMTAGIAGELGMIISNSTSGASSYGKFKIGSNGGGELRFESLSGSFSGSRFGLSAGQAGMSNSFASIYFCTGTDGTPSGNTAVAMQLDTSQNTIFSGNAIVNVAGKTLKIKQGSNACAGTGAVLSGGTVTVNTTAVATGDIIFLSCTAAGGTQGVPRISAISNGASFTITSSSILDTSTYSWLIVKAA